MSNEYVGEDLDDDYEINFDGMLAPTPDYLPGSADPDYVGEDLDDGTYSLSDAWDNAQDDERNELVSSPGFMQWLEKWLQKNRGKTASATATPESFVFGKGARVTETAPATSSWPNPAAIRLAQRAVELWKRDYP